MAGKEKSEVRLGLEAFIASTAEKLASKIEGDLLEIGSTQHGYNKGTFLHHGFKGNFILSDCVSWGPGTIVVDATDMKQFSDNTFGAIVATDVMEHIYEVRKSISEMYRVLKPNGILISTTPFKYMLHRDTRLRNIPNLAELGLEEAVRIDRTTWTDYFRLTPAFYFRALQEAGFKPENIEISSSGKSQNPDGVYVVAKK